MAICDCFPIIKNPPGCECMSVGRDWYRLDDTKREKGCFKLEDWHEADHWSEKKWGTFWTVNEFTGARKKENLKRIKAWAVDIDFGSKLEQRALIKKYILPSSIIETARGYHLYYATDEGTDENYTEVVEKLVYHFNGDPNAKDTVRLLRVPGYMHWKNPEAPFVVKNIYCQNKKFSYKVMSKFFAMPEEEKQNESIKQTMRADLKFTNDNDLFRKIWSLDCEHALSRLSGHPAVCGETFSFKPQGNGKLGLIVNGKSTSCWIDKFKRIGSTDRGGPTIWQWVNWYQKDHKRTHRLLSEIFPELFK